MSAALSVATGDYDRTRALKDGRVTIAGYAARHVTMEPNALFKHQLRRQEFDIAEMSFSTYIAMKAAGAAQTTAIPVFLSRAFRHSAIFVRADRIAAPQDLRGKRVGTPEYLTTMLVWLRGLLADEYGIAPSDLAWRLGGLEQAGGAPKIEPVAGVDIAAIAQSETLSGLLEAGEIDAIFSARPPSCFERGAPHIARLFPDTRAVEQAYYRKTGIYPLMHAVGIRTSLVDETPGLAAATYDAFLAAKDIAVADLQRLSAFALTLPWVEAEYRATQAVLGLDIWPYGLAANRRAVDTLCRYLHEQGFTPRRMAAEELFAEGTCGT